MQGQQAVGCGYVRKQLARLTDNKEAWQTLPTSLSYSYAYVASAFTSAIAADCASVLVP
jgi:hypothetical protein